MDWNKAGQLVASAQTVIVLTHVNPDGDAIGSMLGVAHALLSSGKVVIPAVDGGVPFDLTFIPGSDLVRAGLDGTAADLVIAVDCGDAARMGQVGQAALKLGVPLINLDHHRTNTLFGDANLVDLRTVAASEGVLDWLEQMDIPISAAAAHCLLTGLVTDTLCFRTDNVTSETLGKAQRLMAYGGQLAEIVQHTVSRMSMADFRLWQSVLPLVQLEDHVIWVAIRQEAFAEAGQIGNDDGGLVSKLIEVDEAYVSVVFKEKQDGAVEIGIRAVPGFDTADAAVELGGGGHKLASGATVREPLETLVPRVIELMKHVVRAGAPLVG